MSLQDFRVVCPPSFVSQLTRGYNLDEEYTRKAFEKAPKGYASVLKCIIDYLEDKVNSIHDLNRLNSLRYEYFLAKKAKDAYKAGAPLDQFGNVPIWVEEPMITGYDQSQLI